MVTGISLFFYNPIALYFVLSHTTAELGDRFGTNVAAASVGGHCLVY